MILDEATASVDSDTESRLQRALEALMKGRTALIIAHRLSTIRAVDRIVVPASAVVHLHDKDWVFLPAGGNQFRRVAVALGAQEKDGAQQVISGLKPGDQVVANALQFSSAAEE